MTIAHDPLRRISVIDSPQILPIERKCQPKLGLCIWMHLALAQSVNLSLGFPRSRAFISKCRGGTPPASQTRSTSNQNLLNGDNRAKPSCKRPAPRDSFQPLTQTQELSRASASRSVSNRRRVLLLAGYSSSKAMECPFCKLSLIAPNTP
jgi:hypothetical protein